VSGARRDPASVAARRVGTAPAALLAPMTGARWYRSQIRHVHVDPAVPARHAQPAAPLPDPLRAYLDDAGVELYTHQAAALDRWRAGEDVVVATRTASGKSLAFNLCVAETLLARPDATALYLYPTKALAHDQLERLSGLDAALSLRARPAVYDGDTPSASRRRIRRDSRIVVSNPYGLHEYLAQPLSFQSFWSRLAVVVVDESHRYRGVFGTHVAFVLRRLKRVAERLGGRPRFVLASATVANPDEHAAELVGRPVALVDEDGGPRAQRTVALFDSMADPDRGTLRQAAQVVAALADDGRQTICFTGSRVGAELVAEWSFDLAPARRISAYRAGYQPAERRGVEAQLRARELDAVVSTNALELGIDIGGLDAAVLAGYPGTIASTWQQLGRAGREGRPALGVLVAGDDPLDQYLVRRPETLFGAPVERAVVALDNPEVLASQVMCAAAEFAVREAEADRFGRGLPEALTKLRAEHQVAPAPSGYMYAGTERPASVVRIDGRGEDAIEVRAGDDLVEVLERWRAMREAHTGAILIHRGQRYRVVELDLERRVARVEPVQVREHTRSTLVRDFSLGDARLTRPVGPWSLSLGPVVVRSHVVGFKTMRGDEVVAEQELRLPSVPLRTEGLWLAAQVPAGTLVSPGRHLLGAMHAAEHALIHTMPLLAMCDRGDAGGVSTLVHSGAPGPLVLLYDGFEGGSGIVAQAERCFSQLVELTLDLLATCDCGADGCPRCCYSRLCGSDNEPMDRLGAIELLDALRAVT
jgi:DEAD/DEAH box helicase domain-containing protein